VYSVCTSSTTVEQGARLTNSADFAEIRQNLADSGRPEFKNCRIHCSQIQFFEKSGENTIKTRANSKCSGEEIFSNRHHLIG
jgi:hypothetical protein